MKYRLKLANLDCANCAKKIEREVAKLDGVNSVIVNFVLSTIEFDTEEVNLKSVIKTIKKVEPSIIIDQPANNTFFIDSVLLLICNIIFIPWFIINLINPLGIYNLIVAIPIYLLISYRLFLKCFKNIISGKIFDENFLMIIATIGAFCLNESLEAVGVILFYRIGLYFEHKAISQARKSINNLLDLCPPTVHLITSNGLLKVERIEKVKIGDTILIKAGENIGLDGVVISGESSVDNSAITGESLPVEVGVGDKIISGGINQLAPLKVKVTSDFGSSSLQKIISLVESSSTKKGQAENFITKFARIYTPAVIILSALLAIILPFFNFEIAESIERALILMVISCPCALVLSIPLAYFRTVGMAAKIGVLLKSGISVDNLCKIDHIAFDKTGTLTSEKIVVDEVYVEEGQLKEDLLRLVMLAENFSDHPLAKALRAYDDNVYVGEVENCKEIAGKGVKLDLDGRPLLVGSRRMMGEEGFTLIEGYSLYVIYNNNFIGAIRFKQTIKENVSETITSLQKLGVQTSILSGDSKLATENIAMALNINSYYGELLPEGKVEYIEQFKGNGKIVGFMGDGINDAPALALADVGIALDKQGIAIDAADVVLLKDDITLIPFLIKTSKKCRAIIYQNIILALAVKLAFLSLGALGVASMWEAVIADVGISLLALINTFRIRSNR